jgi:streptogramin lyase
MSTIGGSLLRSSRGGSAAKVALAALLALFCVALMASSARAGTPAFSLGFKYSEGGTTTQFNEPEAIGTDSAGNVYVANKAGRIEKFSPSGKYLMKFGSNGSGAGQFQNPRGVDVDPNGDVWVADYGNNRLVEFNSAGTFIRSFGTAERPIGLAIDNSGNIWYLGAASAGGAAWKIDQNLKYLAAATGIQMPHGIDVDPAGNVWITDYTGVHGYTSTGAVLKSWSVTGVRGIAADATGNVWVGFGCQVRKYSPLGVQLDKFGECGGGAGKLSYLSPGDGISVAPEGAIWVSNTLGSNEVQKWVPTP